jgi:hypothetical protein
MPGSEIMPRSSLECLWWNVQDFAHYEPHRSAVSRWPDSPEKFEAKLTRLTSVIDTIYPAHKPDLIGLCETTPQAARELVAKRFTNHKVVCGQPDQPNTHQVVLLIPRTEMFHDDAPVLIRGGTASSQPIVVSDVKTKLAHFRIFACHWTAFDTEQSQEMRGRAADSLRTAIYDFLNPLSSIAIPRHVVVMGDFNEEPFHQIFVTVHPTGHSFGVARPSLWACSVWPRNSSVFRFCNRSV